jgi:hypothetical protein
MNKSEKRELSNIYTYDAMGEMDTVARALSALIRATLSSKTRDELMFEADKLGVLHNPEFIV